MARHFLREPQSAAGFIEGQSSHPVFGADPGTGLLRHRVGSGIRRMSGGASVI